MPIVQSEAVSLRLNQRGRTKAWRASRRERPLCLQAAGDQVRYLIALTGGFRRRISAKSFLSCRYSAMFPQSPRSPQPQPLPRALECSTFPGKLGLPHHVGRPLGQCVPSAASRRPATPGHPQAPTPILRCSPPPSPDPSPAPCKRSSSLYWLPSCSHHKMRQGERW